MSVAHIDNYAKWLCRIARDIIAIRKIPATLETQHGHT